MFGEIINREAVRNGLDPRIVAAIIAVESRGDPLARRYEPDFFMRYLAGRPKEQLGGHFPTNRSFETEIRDRAYSWGLMQQMGQVVREEGFAGDMAELLTPDASITWGVKKLGKLFVAANHDLNSLLLKWNGGGDRSYPDRVISGVGTELVLNILK